MEEKQNISGIDPETTIIPADAAVNKLEKAEFLKDEVPPEERVPLKEKLAYACGALMDGGGVALMSCVMLKYMTDTLGIVAASASTIMMVSKIWDAVTDPLMGSITDNTRTKMGRRRPFMLFGGVLLVIALALLFAPIKDWWDITSQAGMISYVLIFYIFWNTCSTITQVPYTSMASDISPSFKERNNANTMKLVFSAVAAGLAYVLPLLILGSMEKGAISGTVFWIVMIAVFGTLFGGGLIITALFTKERVLPEKKEKKKFNFKEFIKGYIKPYQNKSYAWHIGMYVAAFTCMDMLSALAAYYASHVWRGVKMSLPIVGEMAFSSMFVVAPIMVAAVLAFPLVRVMMDKKGKAFAFRMGLPFYILGGVLLAVLDPSWCPAWVIPIVAFFMGFGFGGAQMIPWMNFPDTLDVAELALGERPTGNYSGMMTLVRKIGGALGVGIIGWILTGIGYDGYNAATTSADSLLKDYQALIAQLTEQNPGMSATEIANLAQQQNAELSAFATQYADTSSTQIAGFLSNNQDIITTRLNELVNNGKISFDTSKFDISSVADNVGRVLLTIRLLMGISVAVLIAFALFSSFQFHVNNNILTRMRYFSEKVKNGEYDTLTAEEKEERIKLINRHYGKYNKAKDEARIAELTAIAKEGKE